MAQKEHSPLLQQKSLVGASVHTPLSIADMQRSFAKVVTRTIKSLESTVTTEQFATSLLALGAYEPVTKKEKALLDDHEAEICRAETIHEIYRIIRHYMSFFNPELLAYVIETHGTDANRDDFKEYMSKLNSFCQSIVVPPMKFSSKEEALSVERREEVRIKLNLSDRRLQCLRDVKSAIASILGVEKVVLYLDSTVEGSIEVIFLVPKFVVQKLFPLSDVQRTAISSQIDAFKLTVTGGDYIDLLSCQTQVMASPSEERNMSISMVLVQCEDTLKTNIDVSKVTDMMLGAEGVDEILGKPMKKHLEKSKKKADVKFLLAVLKKLELPGFALLLESLEQIGDENHDIALTTIATYIPSLQLPASKTSETAKAAKKIQRIHTVYFKPTKHCDVPSDPEQDLALNIADEPLHKSSQSAVPTFLPSIKLPKPPVNY